MADAFREFRLSRARDAISGGDYAAAEEWLVGLPVADRAPELVAQVEYAIAKALLSQRRWEAAERRLATASKTRIDPLHSERLGLLRNRSKSLDDQAFGTMGAAVDPATRLSERALAPTVQGVWACGAYISRGHRSGMPWSRFLRGAKEATEDREAMLHLACGYLCRFVAERTPLLGLVDVVVPIPANPDRYGSRMLSLPDELARSVEAQLAVPMRFGALSHSGDGAKLSQLSWRERRAAVRRTLSAGDSRGIGGHAVLLVDDITTSGATLVRAAQILTEQGVASVYAVCLAHTEG